MAIQLRHRTQQQRLPSAQSHGVGLPVSDGGLGAVSQALGQVAGAAGQIGTRLAQKEKALEDQTAKNMNSEALMYIQEQGAKIEEARLRGEDPTPLIEEVQAAFEPEHKDYNDWQFFRKAGQKVSEEALEPYKRDLREKVHGVQLGQKSYELTLRTQEEHKRGFDPQHQLTLSMVAGGTYTAAHGQRYKELFEDSMESPFFNVGGSILEGRLVEPKQKLNAFTEAAVELAKRDPNITSANAALDDIKNTVSGLDVKGHEPLERLQAQVVTRIDSLKKEKTSRLGVRSAKNHMATAMREITDSSTTYLDDSRIDSAIDAGVAAIPYASSEEEAADIQDRVNYLEFTRDFQAPENSLYRMGVIMSAGRGEPTWPGDSGASDTVKKEWEDRMATLHESFQEATTGEERARILVPEVSRAMDQIASRTDITESEKLTQISNYYASLTRKPVTEDDLEYEEPSPGQKRATFLAFEDNPEASKPFRATRVQGFQGDGDSFSVIDPKTGSEQDVRLFNFDAPEYNAAGGKEAAEFIRSTLAENEVTVIPRGVDRYGRTLADIKLKDGTSLAKLAASRGHGMLNSNLGKKALFDDTVANLPEEVRDAFGVANIGYHVGEVPGFTNRSESVFTKTKEGNYVKSELEMATDIVAYSEEIQAAGKQIDTVADFYMGSESPEVRTTAGAMKFLSALGGDPQHQSFQVLFTDEIKSGTPTYVNLIAPALGRAERNDFNVYENTRTMDITNTLRANGDHSLASILDGYYEKAVHFLMTGDRANEFKTPQELAEAADRMLLSVFRPIKFSSVNDKMRDTYVTANTLREINIEPNAFYRVIDRDAVSEEQLAGVVLDETVDVFMDYAPETGEFFVFDPPKDDDPSMSQKVKDFRNEVNARFRDFFGGDKNALGLLIDQGDVRISYNHKDDDGTPIVSYQVKQQNGSWRIAKNQVTEEPLSAPLRDLKHVFENPMDVIHARSRKEVTRKMTDPKWNENFPFGVANFLEEKFWEADAAYKKKVGEELLQAAKAGRAGIRGFIENMRRGPEKETFEEAMAELKRKHDNPEWYENFPKGAISAAEKKLTDTFWGVYEEMTQDRGDYPD